MEIVDSLTSLVYSRFNESIHTSIGQSVVAGFDICKKVGLYRNSFGEQAKAHYLYKSVDGANNIRLIDMVVIA